jgi:hypothetical protein
MRIGGAAIGVTPIWTKNSYFPAAATMTFVRVAMDITFLTASAVA